MKKRKKTVALAALLLAAAGLAFLVLSVQDLADKERIELAGRTVSADLPVKTIEFEGRKADIKRMTSTVLLIGTDNYEEELSGTDYLYNKNMGDFLILLVFDDNGKTCTPIQINRDTMCDVPWLTVNGKVGGTVFQQITFAHIYGSGKDDSCRNVCSTVSSLLFGIPIDHYMAVPMSAVPEINDAIGGVQVTLEEDLEKLGPEYVAGAAVVLKGEKALRYVRTRDVALDDSNLARMARQRNYISAFTLQAKNAVNDNADLPVEIFNKLSHNLTTDFSLNAFLDFSDKLEDYNIQSVLYPNGELRMGEQWAEFYVDKNSLFDVVCEAICE